MDKFEMSQKYLVDTDFSLTDGHRFFQIYTDCGKQGFLCNLFSSV
jgi:hypothetical protein